ncbi:MAG: GxxExxY protein [Gammaproteobacteria bacterium]|nr:MAG: GxxExxY protein [Gammaproteobacteria bacterium]
MDDNINFITGQVVDSAIAVHKELGPGLLESTYEACLAHELVNRGLSVERQKNMPVTYRGTKIDCGYRLDLLVNGHVIVELKAVERFDRIHEAQLLSYLKLSDKKVGLLINFNVKRLKDGMRRFVH